MKEEIQNILDTYRYEDKLTDEQAINEILKVCMGSPEYTIFDEDDMEKAFHGGIDFANSHYFGYNFDKFIKKYKGL